MFRGGQSSELTFGETRVLVELSLSADELEAVVATLAPVDPAALIDPFNARQAELRPLGLYFAL